jgi:uncharacterized protein
VIPRLLSHFTVRPLIEARRRGTTSAQVSLDLGRSTTTVGIDEAGARLPDGILRWDAVEVIAKSDRACFAIEPEADGTIRAEAIKAFSEELGRAYTLYPTERAPTMLISGIPMHRIKGIDPLADTDRKIAALRPIGARTLDTATGLGYTAIRLVATGAQVTTIELDPLVLEVARRNPWSAELFEQPRIQQRIGDAAEIVAELPAASFDSVLHDPPMLSLAGEMFGAAFYRELLRVLRPGGGLFHYVGNPASPSGARTTKGVVRRLSEVGFGQVRTRPEAFAITALRPGGRDRR